MTSDPVARQREVNPGTRRRIPTSASSQPRPSGCGSPHYPSRALACAPRATVWRFAEAPDAGALAVARSPRKRPALSKQKSNWVRMVALRTSRTCSTRRSPDCCFRASNAVAIGRCAAREEVRSLAHHSARCRSHLASQRSRSRPRTDRRFPERSGGEASPAASTLTESSGHWWKEQ